MWDVKACRSCLTVKGKLEKIGDASKRQYSAITGLQISESDGYPSYFCVECRHHIRKSLAFRRKSRRAHFVLKEIMTVRKQISYSDIVTVNRKKTNLESALSFWEPSNNSCFLIANEEGNEKDSLKKYDLEEPHTQLHSKHLVEITPDQDTEIPEETNEQKDEEFFNDDIPTNDYLEPESDIDPANIDMNDIFKDLTDENDNQSDDNDFEESYKPPKKPQPIKFIDELEITNYFSINSIIQSLVLFDLTTLTLGKQKEKFELRKRIAPFAKAPYKCAMCLTIHKDMEGLVKHVKYHNERKYPCECQVCKNKFPSELDLTAHVATCHLYEYNCRICAARVYSQMDAVSHAKEYHSHENSILNSNVINRRRERKRALSNFSIAPLSQRMMSDVMLLRSRPEHNKTAKPELLKPSEKFDFKCDICGIGLKSHQTLEKHMVLKHRYMYTCNICKEVFTTRVQALQHNEDTHAQYKCDDCGKVFGKVKKLISHCSKMHSKKIPCNLCGYSAKTEKGYYKHQVLEHGYVSKNDPLLGDPQYKCGTEQCGVQFANQRSLEVHLVDMNHAGAEKVPYACVPCRKMYENDEELETHYITCQKAKKYPRKCCYCTEVLRSSIEYKLHYIHVHPTLQYRYATQNAICDICGKSIFKPLLESHRRTHTDLAYECRLCTTVSTAPAAHLSHLLANHARRPYKCALCMRRFKFRGNCKDHILKVHAPTKLFKCEFCAAEFSYFRSLKEHAEKLHSLVIPPVKPKIALKSKTKLYVYAHMKIIINEQEREVVEKLNVELIDYLEQKSKPVNFNDYFIFTDLAEEVSLCKKKRIRKRKKKQTEVEAAVAQITIDWVKPLKDENSVLNEAGEVKDVVLNEVGEVEDVDLNEVGEMKDVVLNEVGKMKDVVLNEVGAVKDDVLNEGEMQMEVEVDKFEIDCERPLEVVESDGQQYVMINGEMYRIAAEGDE